MKILSFLAGSVVLAGAYAYGQESKFYQHYFNLSTTPQLKGKLSAGEIPEGELNECLFPEYISKTFNRDWVKKEISPSALAGAGAQITGRINIENSNIKPFYLLHKANDLHGEKGAGIRSLKGNSMKRVPMATKHGAVI